jgi:hypothetical protein
VLKVEADDSGAVRFENLVARNTDDNQSLTGLFVGENHAGDLRLDDCTIEQFSDNGLYASAPGGAGGGNGPVRVNGGTYRNNNVSGVRLGTTGSSATDVTIVVDAETPGSGGLNARGIRLRNKSGQVIDNCWIRFGENAPESFGGIVCHPANGGATVRDTTITVDKASIPAIRTFPTEGATGETLTVENCTISGSTGGGVLGRIEGRDGTVFRDCTIEHRGEQRHGLRFIDSSNCRIVDSRIDVSTVPVTVENGTVTIENTTVATGNGDRYIEQRTLENETLDVSPEAGVGIADQTTDGTSVVVSNFAFGTTGRSLGIWSTTDGELDTLLGSVTSPNSGTDTSVELDQTVATSQPVVAAIHGDTTPTTANVLAQDSASLALQQESDETLARFDTNGQSGIQIDEVMDAITEYNSGGTIGGEPVGIQDVMAVISEYNS